MLFVKKDGATRRELSLILVCQDLLFDDKN